MEGYMNKETSLLTKENSAFIVRKALQTGFCMDYDTYCEVMHNGVGDYYAKEKFNKMQRNFTRWFCDLDKTYSHKFMEYVLNAGD